MFRDEDLIPLSALQHFVFCPRQCALIHLEGIWKENRLTAEGRILHENADQPGFEKRGNIRIERAVAIRSLEFGLIGKADVVEFHKGEPYPVEYKRGTPKPDGCDKVQLCAQALCLEEMMNTNITEGAIYYGKPRRREVIAINRQLREVTKGICTQVHNLIKSGQTPDCSYSAKKCRNCSLLSECMPNRSSSRNRVGYYLKKISAIDAIDE